MANVLVIDDDDQFRMMLRHMLEEEGFQVFEAAHGDDGLKMYRTHPIDLILLDIFMPEKDGLETIQALKREMTDTKIIAMSGGGRRGFYDYLEYAGIFGAQKTLKKPFDPSELLEAIHQVFAEEVQ